MVSLKALLDRLEDAGLVLEKQGRFDNITIDRMAHDSRKVGPGGLFVAIRGEKADGHLFIDKAVQNGATAIVAEAMPEEHDFSGIAFIRVSSTRAALAELAAAFYGDPSRRLTMVGITGTNGKTTTAFLVHDLLTRLGQRAGLMGTVEIRIGGEVIDAAMTTPDALEVNRLLCEMVEAGCTACVMEVSSHALDQERVRGLVYDAAVFTNLTRDHLDYHASFEAYLAAKKKLFDGLAPEATALYNLDDPAGARMVADTRAQLHAYGRSPGAALHVEVLENRIEGLRLRIDGQERRFRLVGLFNAYNLAAAYGVGRTLGYAGPEVMDALAAAPPVPGRFEQFQFDDGTTAIVDYAHTPDALENVLKTIHETKPAQAAVWCVFGCGGDRDREKRPMMGAVAEQWADYVIVTSDNPRTEDPEAILDDIQAGMAHPEQSLRVVERREALREAAARARPGDVVLVAGKGHETYQIVGEERKSFDDREEVKKIFGSRA